jgi:tetratricopeptide (TPR) repeat protein
MNSNFIWPALVMGYLGQTHSSKELGELKRISSQIGDLSSSINAAHKEQMNAFSSMLDQLTSINCALKSPTQTAGKELFSIGVSLFKKQLYEHALEKLTKAHEYINCDISLNYLIALVSLSLWCEDGNSIHLERAKRYFMDTIKLAQASLSEEGQNDYINIIACSLTNLALISFHEKDYSLSKELCKKAINTDDGLAEPHYILAKNGLHTADINLTIENISNAIKKNPLLFEVIESDSELLSVPTIKDSINTILNSNKNDATLAFEIMSSLAEDLISIYYEFPKGKQEIEFLKITGDFSKSLKKFYSYLDIYSKMSPSAGNFDFEFIRNAWGAAQCCFEMGRFCDYVAIKKLYLIVQDIMRNRRLTNSYVEVEAPLYDSEDIKDYQKVRGVRVPSLPKNIVETSEPQFVHSMKYDPMEYMSWSHKMIEEAKHYTNITQDGKVRLTFGENCAHINVPEILTREEYKALKAFKEKHAEILEVYREKTSLYREKNSLCISCGEKLSIISRMSKNKRCMNCSTKS